MASDEVNLLVYTYLAEHQFTHSAYALFNEATLKEYVNSGNGEDENTPTIPQTDQLVRILQKGLLYLQAEAKHRGVSARLVGVLYTELTL
jgi:hypothetical protein